MAEFQAKVEEVSRQLLTTLAGEEELAGNCDYVLDSLLFISAKLKKDMRKYVNETFGCGKEAKDRLVDCAAALQKLRKESVKATTSEELSALPRKDIVFDWLVARLREDLKQRGL